MLESLEPVTVHTWEGDKLQLRQDALAVEEPLEVRVRDQAIAVTMRTPGHDEELVAGFLLGEGLIRRRDELVDVLPCGKNEHGNAMNARLGPLVQFDVQKLSRHVQTTSSCGVCGKASIESVRAMCGPVAAGPVIAHGVLCGMPEAMRKAQSTFSVTGGLHAAAIFDACGTMLALREDVGRHNAVDKAIGRLFLDGKVPLSGCVLLVSGRASYEIVQKAAAAGIGVVAAVSAPSSLAVRLAEEMGQTLVGFLRPPRFNVYSHPERIE